MPSSWTAKLIQDPSEQQLHWLLETRAIGDKPQAMRKEPSVYIMTNKRCGTLYIGVTSNLPARVWQHRMGTFGGFTKNYGLTQLVWYEAHPTMEAAISREKKLKFWRRDWKIDLVNSFNPDWDDLFETLSPL